MTDNLEQRLAALTEPADAPAELWRRALPERKRRLGFNALLRRPIGSPWLYGAVAVIALFAVTVALLPSLGKARSAGLSALTEGAGAVEKKVRAGRSVSGDETLRARVGGVPEVGRGFKSFGVPQDSAGLSAGLPITLGQTFERTEPVAPADAARQVIRKATIELTTPDVRATMLKAGMLLNLGSGEFTEGSSLTGEGKSASATLILRVAADRLGAVLSSLRALGVVTSEQTTGEDVTDQVVDVEARLRNEQRVEAELLELLTKRNDAPLKEILDLRTELAKVRDSIERLVARRDRLGHLVSLATILVVIRTDASPVPAAEKPGIFAYFKTSVAESWHTGLNYLADTVAFFIRIAIGGIIWWALAIIAIAVALSIRRRARALAAIEPVPVE